MFQTALLGTLESMKSLSRQEILLLSAPERLSLIGDLWDSLTDSDLALPVAQARELEKRLDSFAVDQTSAISWAELRAELAGRAS